MRRGGVRGQARCGRRVVPFRSGRGRAGRRRRPCRGGGWCGAVRSRDRGGGRRGLGPFLRGTGRHRLATAENDFAAVAAVTGDGDGRHQPGHHLAHRLGGRAHRVLAARRERGIGPERAAVGDLMPVTMVVPGRMVVAGFVTLHGKAESAGERLVFICAAEAIAAGCAAVGVEGGPDLVVGDRLPARGRPAAVLDWPGVVGRRIVCWRGRLRPGTARRDTGASGHRRGRLSGTLAEAGGRVCRDGEVIAAVRGAGRHVPAITLGADRAALF